MCLCLLHAISVPSLLVVHAVQTLPGQGDHVALWREYVRVFHVECVADAVPAPAAILSGLVLAPSIHAALVVLLVVAVVTVDQLDPGVLVFLQALGAHVILAVHSVDVALVSLVVLGIIVLGLAAHLVHLVATAVVPMAVIPTAVVPSVAGVLVLMLPVGLAAHAAPVAHAVLLVHAVLAAVHAVLVGAVLAVAVHVAGPGVVHVSAAAVDLSP